MNSAAIIADLTAAGWRVIQRRNSRYDLELIAAPGQMHSRGVSWNDVERHWRGQCQRMEKTMIDTIICGDARDLSQRIEDASVDLVFTDPVYDRIDDYAWLAETAMRILNPGGSCLAWCSNVGQYDVKPAMERFLRFVMPLTYTKIAKSYRARAYRTFLWTTPLLWFVKPSTEGTLADHKRHEWLIDTVIDVDRLESNTVVTAQAPPRETYKWHKNPEAYAYWLEQLSKPGDTIYDPFCGSGSLPVLCKQRGRHFIASEINHDVAQQAQKRLEATQTPHRDLLPSQIPLALTDFNETGEIQAMTRK